jgi:hypothetical protein
VNELMLEMLIKQKNWRGRLKKCLVSRKCLLSSYFAHFHQVSSGLEIEYKLWNIFLI